MTIVGRKEVIPIISASVYSPQQPWCFASLHRCWALSDKPVSHVSFWALQIKCSFFWALCGNEDNWASSSALLLSQRKKQHVSIASPLSLQWMLTLSMSALFLVTQPSLYTKCFAWSLYKQYAGRRQRGCSCCVSAGFWSFGLCLSCGANSQPVSSWATACSTSRSSSAARRLKTRPS